MRMLVRGVALLLFLALAGFWFTFQETRFALAAIAIVCLVELALALRMRARGQPTPGDPSRLLAAEVSCTEQDGAVMVRLTGESEGRASAPYVLLSRALRPQEGSTAGDGPYLELSDRRRSVHGGIQDAYLSPQLLRLELDPRATEVLGADRVCVTLRHATEQRRLERALSRILRGVPFTSERSMPEAVADVASS